MTTDAARVAAWPRALPARRSPCRIDRTLGIRQHRCSGFHAAMVESYRDWRDAEHARADAADAAQPWRSRNEPGTYWQTHERPTFRAFLLTHTQHAR